MEILRKITAKEVLGKRPQAPAEGTSKPLMQVWGMARDVSVMTNDKGEYARFRGRFQAMNMETGAAYESGFLILPEPASGMLYGALAEGNGGTVSFAFEVGVRHDAESVTQYVYTARPLMEQDEADPLTMLREKAGIKAPQLSAPEPEPTPEPEPEPEKAKASTGKK